MTIYATTCAQPMLLRGAWRSFPKPRAASPRGSRHDTPVLLGGRWPTPETSTATIIRMWRRLVYGDMKPNSLIYGARYGKMMEAFGGKGLFVEHPKDIRGALDDA